MYLQFALYAACGFAAIYVIILIVFRSKPTNILMDDFDRPPTSPEELSSFQLGPIAEHDPRQLYIDLLMRAVSNILYEDKPYWFLEDGDKKVIGKGFRLDKRVEGEDFPSMSHTMIGIKRLRNLHYCIEQVIENNVPGDIIETGVFCGGASIFANGVLRAHNVTDRKVYACDTFAPPLKPPSPLVTTFALPIVKALAAIDHPRWRRMCYPVLMKITGQDKRFPLSKDMGDDFVSLIAWALRHADSMMPEKKASLEHVKSNFARYGLLDENVVFLQGFFSETLPDAPIETLSVIRLDGDVYDSTMQAIEMLYPKLSPGGFCIVDDYLAFAECQQAISDYREQHNITDEIVEIDNIAAYWVKS